MSDEQRNQAESDGGATDERESREGDVEGHKSSNIFAVKGSDEAAIEDVEGHKSSKIFAVKDSDDAEDRPA